MWLPTSFLASEGTPDGYDFSGLDKAILSTFVTARNGTQQVIIYRAMVLRIQQQLKARGYFSHEPNSNFDELTTAALIEFQKSKNLPATGLPDQVTLAHLL